MHKYLRVCLLSITLSLLLIGSTAAQWSKIGDLGPCTVCGYFWNADRGLVAASTQPLGKAYPDRIYLTSDRGKTWVSANIPTVPAGAQVYINSVQMRDSLVGWAALDFDYSPINTIPGVWSTTDGGKNWVVVPGSLEWSSVEETGSGRLATSYGGIALEDDRLHGITSVAFHFQNSIPGTQRYTADGGASWVSLPFSFDESWGIAYSSYYNSYFICPEDAGNGGYTGQFFASMDRGQSWQLRSVPEPRPIGTWGTTTGDVECVGKAIYLQSRKNGMLRSTDGGASWLSIGGPSNTFDTRFCVPKNCNGGTIVAFDTAGGVWLTTNGGDGAIPEPPISVFSASTTSASACGSSRFPVIVENLPCANSRLVRVGLENDTTHDFTIEGADSVMVGSGSADTIWIDFDPHKRIATRTVRVHVRGAYATGGAQPFDSVYTITATVKPVPPKLTASVSVIELGSVSTCTTRDSSYTLRNVGCDTLTLDSLPSVLANGFSLTGATLPLRIAPDSGVTFRMHYAPTLPGSLYQSLKYQAVQQGLSTTLEILVEGSAVAGGAHAVLTNTLLTLAPISICAQDSARTSIANAGCDPLVIDSVWMSGDPDLSLGPIIFPSTLGTGDSLAVQVELIPMKKGARTALLHFRAHGSKGNPASFDSTILITSSVTSGAAVLSIDTAGRDLGLISICSERDTTIIFQNTGCDSLWLNAVDLNDPHFFLLGGKSLPEVLAPGMGDTLHIRFTPTDTNLAQATLRLRSNSVTDSVISIPFSASAHGKADVTIRMSLTRTNIGAGDTTTLFVFSGGYVANRGLRTLGFTVDYDGDLLTLVRSNTAIVGAVLTVGAAIRSGDKTSLPVTLSSPELSLDPSTPIAALHFRTTLADSAATRVLLRDLTLNGGDSLYAACTLSAQTVDTALFALSYQCSDSIIASNLRHEPLRLTVQPNPSSGDIELVSSQDLQSVELKIFDVLGTIRYSTHATLRAKQPYTLPSLPLPSGTYLLRLKTPKAVQTVRIIRSR
jgi:hypothetical protein